VVKTGEDAAVFVHTCATQEQAEAAVQRAAAWVLDNVADLIRAVETHVGRLVVTSRAGP
jgi:hypothetical protein